MTQPSGPSAREKIWLLTVGDGFYFVRHKDIPTPVLVAKFLPFLDWRLKRAKQKLERLAAILNKHFPIDSEQP